FRPRGWLADPVNFAAQFQLALKGRPCSSSIPAFPIRRKSAEEVGQIIVNRIERIYTNAPLELILAKRNAIVFRTIRLSKSLRFGQLNARVIGVPTNEHLLLPKHRQHT